jgi:hypothetical protein
MLDGSRDECFLLPAADCRPYKDNLLERLVVVWWTVSFPRDLWL